MTKQEFLAMSLPHDLVGITQNRLVKINGINYENQLPIIWDSINKEKSDFSGICGFGIMLILRPLSDLTKEIEHKGEKFIPIIELTNICYNNIFTTKPTIKEYETLFDDRSFGFVGYTDEERISLTYVDDFNRNEFEFRISKNKMNIQQLALFQKLIEWHFDIANLISKGEAIDVNTLEINPYK